MNAPTQERTEPRATPLKNIPEALRSLWKACLPDSGDGDVARSLTINFVGIAPVREEAALRAATDRLQRRTPCRAFLLLVDDGARDVTADVAAATRCHGALRDIVLEEIVVRLPEQGFDRIPGLVRPLLVNDLPNHLFWRGPLARQETHFHALASLCDHVVVDSRQFENAYEELRLLEARSKVGRPATDLSWLRLRPWRRVLAEAFERVPWRPGTPASGTIRHGRAGTAGALLLARWLGDRLGARMELTASGDAEVPGPDRVSLQAGECEIELVAAGTQITAHVSTPAHCYLPFKVPTSRGTDGDLLAAAIDIG